MNAVNNKVLRRLSWVLVSVSLALGGAVHFTACSPTYVARAAYEEARILWSREPIEELIDDTNLDGDTRIKLSRVLEARAFAPTIGLTPADTFTAFSDIGREELAWVLMGARKDSFSLHGWWFPIVGTVPYKGFFDKSDAEEQARELENDGYETRIRPTDAFSTLGWFNDPLLSTTLRRDEVEIVTTVLHEIVHSTLWFPGHVAFNESLAQFIAVEAAVDFYQSLKPYNHKTIAQAENNRAANYFISVALEKAYTALDALYKSKLSSEEKIAQRQVTYEQSFQDFLHRFPKATSMRELNNATLMQQRIYLTGVPCFRGIFYQTNRDWKSFWATLRKVKDQVDNGKSPHSVLHEMYPSFCDASPAT